MEINWKFLGLLIVSILLAIGFYVSITADYEIGGSTCGKGRAKFETVGFSTKGFIPRGFQDIDFPCPGGSSSQTQRLFIFADKAAHDIFEGEGTMRTYIKKNGVICAEKTVSGKGKLVISISCNK